MPCAVTKINQLGVLVFHFLLLFSRRVFASLLFFFPFASLPTLSLSRRPGPPALARCARPACCALRSSTADALPRLCTPRCRLPFATESFVLLNSENVRRTLVSPANKQWTTPRTFLMDETARECIMVRPENVGEMAE